MSLTVRAPVDDGVESLERNVHPASRLDLKHPYGFEELLPEHLARVHGHAMVARIEFPHFTSPSSNTISASPSPTAARMDLPSGDHDTRRAMKVARSPKSVTCRHATRPRGERPDVRGVAVRERHRQPLPVGREGGIHDLPAWHARRRNTSDAREGPSSGVAARISSSGVHQGGVVLRCSTVSHRAHR